MEAMNFGVRFDDERKSVPMSVTNFWEKYGKKSDDRILKIPETRFGPKVLVENWYYRKENEEAPDNHKTTNDWKTSYTNSYMLHPCDLDAWRTLQSDAEEIAAKAQGCGTSLLLNHHGEAYHSNKTTTYDLSYRILPDQCKSSEPALRTFNARQRRWLPLQDYAKVYGNLTDFGLSDWMQCEWNIQNRFHRWCTTYQTEHNFKAVEHPEKRFVKPSADWNEVNLELLHT